MASVAKCGSGYRIIFNGPDGERKAIRLPGFNKRTALAVKVRVEELVQATMANAPVARDCAAWLSGISPALHDKLAAVGLVAPQAKSTVAEFIAQWLARREKGDYAPGSLCAWRQTCAELTRLFGGVLITAFGCEEAERYRDFMRERGLRPATIRKRLQHSQTIFTDAQRLRLVAENPFQHVKQRLGDVSERRAYIPAADALRCIDAAPNALWRLLIALSRFGGLRVPSEALSLRWEHVDWERGRLVVPSPKTKHCGKAWRVIPVFPTVRQYLEEAFELAPEGADYIFPEAWRQRANTGEGWVRCNLRTQLGKIVRRAGLAPWPRLWHSLRASCESDLAAKFPLAVVTKWLGNTPSVALRHYVDPTDSAYEQAATIDPFGAARGGGGEGQSDAEKAVQQAARQAARATSEMAARRAAQCTSVHIRNDR